VLYRSTLETSDRTKTTISPKILLLSANILAVALLVLQALTGHAAALSPGITQAIIIDSLHMMAAGLWVGGLLALIIGVIPILRHNKAEFTNLVKATWGSYGKYAAMSVGVVFATGLYNTGRQVASLDALLTTLYGQLLLSKIGLMMVVGMFGMLNSMMLHPQLVAPLARLLRRPHGWTPIALKRLPYLVLVEFSLGLLVFLFVGMITSTSPARGSEFAPSARDLPNSLSQEVDDLLVSFSAQPNQPGENLITVRAVSTRRPPPAEIMRLILRFTFQDRDLGTSSLDAVEIEPGVYRAGGNSLSMTGVWKVQVIVRRKGIEDSTATFNWTVASPGTARPRLISNQPWGTFLGIVAGVILASIFSLAIGIRVFVRPRVSDEDPWP
jgi:copper transport protein